MCTRYHNIVRKLSYLVVVETQDGNTQMQNSTIANENTR